MVQSCTWTTKPGHALPSLIVNDLTGIPTPFYKEELKSPAHLKQLLFDFLGIGVRLGGGKTLHLRTASRTWLRAGKANRWVTHAIKISRFGKWPICATLHPSKVVFHFPPVFRIFVGEQFWGRAVRASRDSMNPGRSLLVGTIFRVPPWTEFPGFLLLRFCPTTCCETQRRG